MTSSLAPFVDMLYKEMLGRIQQTDLDVPVRRGEWFNDSRTVRGPPVPRSDRRRKATATMAPTTSWHRGKCCWTCMKWPEARRSISLGDMAISDDGAWLLYTTDETGFRQYKLYRKSLASGKVDGPLAERVTSVQWAADNATVFFTTEHPVTKRSDTLWRLGSSGKPEAVYAESDELFRIYLERSKDRKYLVLRAFSTDTWESRLLDASRPEGSFEPVLQREKGHKYEVEHRDGLLYIRTNRGAKNFRVVTAPVGRPAQWTAFVADRADVLIQGIEPFRDHLVITEKQAGLTRLGIYDFIQGRWREVPFRGRRLRRGWHGHAGVQQHGVPLPLPELG